MEPTISNVKKFNKINKPFTRDEWIEKWIPSIDVLLKKLITTK